MRTSTIVCVAAVFLAGCNAGQLTLGAPPATPIRGGASLVSGKDSWMNPGASKLDLLYVSDFEKNNVYAYSYPQGRLSGVLKGILKYSVYPSGLCADKAGDVFVPQSGSSVVAEYEHGSTKLVRTLQDPTEYPYSCAVDPMSGDLAVVNLESVTGAGGVSVYAQARGSPKKYRYGYAYKYFFASYDGEGNLFVDASYTSPREPFAFLELPKDGKALRRITLNQAFGIAAGVAWDGKYVTVGDSKSSKIYRFDISKAKGKKIGSTALNGGRFITQFLIVGNTIVAANFHGKSVRFWRYPSGGAPTVTIDGLGYPFGVALSKVPARKIP